ncbi:MAG: HEAT repeat domain-containing protein [Myxococcales bacterium]|nr:HEAT repeat domain-containing protein [Myxococcales bacterium]
MLHDALRSSLGHFAQRTRDDYPTQGPIPPTSRQDREMARAYAIKERIHRAYRVMSCSGAQPQNKKQAGWQLRSPEHFDPLWDEALSEWSALLQHPHAKPRTFAIQHLPLLPRPEITDLIASSLDDRAPRVRQAAYQSLGQCGPYARPQLQDLLTRYLSPWPAPESPQGLKPCLHRLAPFGRGLVFETFSQGTRDERYRLYTLFDQFEPSSRDRAGRFGRQWQAHLKQLEQSEGSPNDPLQGLLALLEEPILALGLELLEEIAPSSSFWSGELDALLQWRALLAIFQLPPSKMRDRQRMLRSNLRELLHDWLFYGGFFWLEAWLSQPQALLSLAPQDPATLALCIFFSALCRLLQTTPPPRL